MMKISRLYLIAVICFLSVDFIFADSVTQEAESFYAAGKYKEAYALYEDALLKEDATGNKANYLHMSLRCLYDLSLVNEADALLEKVVAKYNSNWRILKQAAHEYLALPHYGYLISDEFSRSHHRGGGKRVSSFASDKVKALKLFNRSREVIINDKSAQEYEKSDLLISYANAFLYSYNDNIYQKMQILTDFNQLPDFAEERYGYYHQKNRVPVNDKNEAVFFYCPESFASSKNDGERWRYLLYEASQADKKSYARTKKILADFYYQYFNVSCLSGHDIFTGERAANTSFDLEKLADDEFIVNLSSGIRKLNLSEEFNFIAIYHELSDSKSSEIYNSLEKLYSIYLNRRQYAKAVKIVERMIEVLGSNKSRKERLKQLTGNWGTLENDKMKSAGTDNSVYFRFRNGRRVNFTARKIDAGKFIDSVKSYLESNPLKIEWQKINLHDIGRHIVDEGGDKYFTGEDVEWKLNLKPLEGHKDLRIPVKLPFTDHGLYMLESSMDGGNKSRIIVWLSNTVIVTKPVDQGNVYMLFDALSGEPLKNKVVNFFGYRQQRIDEDSWLARMIRRYNVLTKKFDLTSDNLGKVRVNKEQLDRNYQWLVSVNDKERMAFLGFEHIWFSSRHSNHYNQLKSFFISDRPLYKPGDKVNIRMWLRKASYDLEDISSYAGAKESIELINPKGEIVKTELIELDQYAGGDFSFTLKENAALGVWRVRGRNGYSYQFRVEEYKKPEFEVLIQPDFKTVKLGAAFNVDVSGRYYHGTPVRKGLVKIKVTRSEKSNDWYPPMPWDWLYGRGYGWIVYEYSWYPFWDDWGIKSPRCWWWNPLPKKAPEVVAEIEEKIQSKGKISFRIDTALAKELYSDRDHVYNIEASITDMSRRTITGSGKVNAVRKTFKIYPSLHKGFYSKGDVVEASFNVVDTDGNPVKARGLMTLYSINKEDGKIREDKVFSEEVAGSDAGLIKSKFNAKKGGQFRLECELKNNEGEKALGAVIFNVRGSADVNKSFVFNELEIIPEKREYKSGETLSLELRSKYKDALVVLFIKPENGVYPPPVYLRLKGHSVLRKIPVEITDMPNFFIEGFIVKKAQIYKSEREIFVPPAKRIVNMDIKLDKESYEPGEEAAIKIKVADRLGNPLQGNVALTVYDRSLEYISPYSMPDIRKFFWDFRNRHYSGGRDSLSKYFYPLFKRGEKTMQVLGKFGAAVEGKMVGASNDGGHAVAKGDALMSRSVKKQSFALCKSAAPMAECQADEAICDKESAAGETIKKPAIKIRKDFADTAFFNGVVQTDEEGEAVVKFKMPDNISGWKVKSWFVGHGTKVGESDVSTVTKKNFMIRMQTPRFFVEKDSVIVSMNIHNEMDRDIKAKALLEIDGNSLKAEGEHEKIVEIKKHDEVRVDFKLKVLKEGDALIRMSAFSDQYSDAMEMTLPVFVFGSEISVLKSGFLSREEKEKNIDFSIPLERRKEETKLLLEYNTNILVPLLKALPYLLKYPYGCTEQTLNRFLPALICKNVVSNFDLDLNDFFGDKIKDADIKRDLQPVFDNKQMQAIVQRGLKRLKSMQLSDGGWGWFSGYGEYSSPHTTVQVVRGLLKAKEMGEFVEDSVLKNGIAWLNNYQKRELRKLKNAEKAIKPWKKRADNIDAYIFYVLDLSGNYNREMGSYLYRDRLSLSNYAKAMVALSFHKAALEEERDMLVNNIEQFLTIDKENGTAFLRANNYWWYWYGAEFEAMAMYLKLANTLYPDAYKTQGVARYLLNNRSNGSYWQSTRDTALCIEALAEYTLKNDLKGETFNLKVYLNDEEIDAISFGGDKLHQGAVTSMEGEELKSGEHTISIRKDNDAIIHWGMELKYFSLEDKIKPEGLEVKVTRNYFLLKDEDKQQASFSDKGRVVNENIKTVKRIPLQEGDKVVSGDNVLVELGVESKNDYEYIIIEDYKAAGFENVDLRSGYNGNEMNAYVEFRDEKTAFFIRNLARGNHSLSYKLRAETPGTFHALPAKISAMYAEKLRGNSGSFTIQVDDRTDLF